MAEPSVEDIDAVLRHLPVVCAPDFHAGDMRGGERKDGTLSMPYFETSPALDALVRALYAHHFILEGFDWPSWQPEAERYAKDPELIRGADLLTLRKLFTVHVRKERFCDGHLAQVVESGQLLALLQRLEALR